MRALWIAIGLSPLLATGCDGAPKAKSSGEVAPPAQRPPDKSDQSATNPTGKPTGKPPAPKADARTWTFDSDGPIPAGFRVAETASVGTPATWATVKADDAPSPPTVFGVTESANAKTSYNLAIADGVSMTDVDITVMVKAVSGVKDQGGGPIWRVKDADNYYIARWNPLEKNVRFYVVQGGVRSALAAATVELPTDRYHSLRVIAEGTTMELLVNDEPVLRAEDSMHTGPGSVGLWTKADAATLFDDLSIASP